MKNEKSFTKAILRAMCEDRAAECLRPIQHKLNNTDYRMMIRRIAIALIEQNDRAFKQATHRAKIHAQEGFEL